MKQDVSHRCPPSKGHLFYELNYGVTHNTNSWAAAPPLTNKSSSADYWNACNKVSEMEKHREQLENRFGWQYSHSDNAWKPSSNANALWVNFLFSFAMGRVASFVLKCSNGKEKKQSAKTKHKKKNKNQRTFCLLILSNRNLYRSMCIVWFHLSTL